MLQAIRASKMDAYRELAEQLSSQQVRGQSSYKDLTQTSNSLDVSVAGMVRGARVAATYPRGNTYATRAGARHPQPLSPEPADGGPVLGRVRGAGMSRAIITAQTKASRLTAFVLSGRGSDLRGITRGCRVGQDRGLVRITRIGVLGRAGLLQEKRT